MICPECGSYQPDRAKYCGICGAGLSQDGLVESFLKREPDHDIVLPRHRSLWYYAAVLCIVITALAVVAGAGYLVYRIAWGEEEAEESGGGTVDTTQEYIDTELGYSFSYPDTWSVAQEVPGESEVAALSIDLTTRKGIDLCVLQLDPVISIGGIGAIEEYLAEDAAARMLGLGGRPGPSDVSLPAGGQAGYGQEGDAQSQPEAGTPPEGTEQAAPKDLFDSTRVSGLPAFYTEFTANYMGEETEFLLYYIVAGDSVFVFQGHAPYAEFKDVRPQFFAITGSFKWEESDGETAPDEIPGISAPAGIGRSPVITF